ncbi:hypothetical protein Pint_19176 [Pistacia integerrima]|uniref:Uncharacterized protein n=1 Tax=Pistacia integerrima TaxID=434235 RepID=A0ACC0Z0T4_9ROSI|nr:hypothetical protein Pint_19176 [Pistacia integerrima]
MRILLELSPERERSNSNLRNLHYVIKSFPSNPMPLSSPKNKLLFIPNQGASASRIAAVYAVPG